jgi:cyclohexanecarboxylate-CoA ligase
VRVVDDEGRTLPVGQTGRLLVRGAQMFMGYYQRPDMRDLDADGWFDTGDLAYMDADGYIRINGRTKDVLIRGARTCRWSRSRRCCTSTRRWPPRRSSATPISGSASAAARVSRCVPARASRSPTCRPTWPTARSRSSTGPERVEILPDLPRTPSGKIQKFKLRELVAGA